MRLVFDIETDGLYDDVTTLWCMSIKNLDTRENNIYRCDIEGSIEEGLSLLSKAKQVIGHGIINYDLPVLRKLVGFELPNDTQITDTLILSRLFHPDRIGGHSLRAWGERLGFPKGDYDDWTGGLTEEMVTYCLRDSEVTEALYGALKKEIKGQSWGESIEIEHKVAFIISEQQVNGVEFDISKALFLRWKMERRVTALDKKIVPLLPTTVAPRGTVVRNPFLKYGGLSVRAKVFLTPTTKIGGPFQPIEYKTTDLNSDHQVKLWLEKMGWKATEFTPTGGGRLTPDSFDSLPDANLGVLLKERSNLNHRVGAVTGWIDRIRNDYRLTAAANSCGTNTGRMRHSNVINVPSVHAFMGKEMRSLFTVRDGYTLVGHDASGLELRMLAHYMNDDTYTEALLHGDIHSHNQELAGLHTREAAKTFIYAFIYGAADAKLGSIVEGDELAGAELRSKFLRENPKLSRLIPKAQRAARERGYLIGLDGRRIWLRRDERGRVLAHKALNALLQSAGAIVMKKSMVLLDQWAKEEGLEYKKVLDMHDEGQAEVLTEHSERYAELAIKSIVEAGIHFKMNLPLAAEAKIGTNWAETH